MTQKTRVNESPRFGPHSCHEILAEGRADDAQIEVHVNNIASLQECRPEWELGRVPNHPPRGAAQTMPVEQGHDISIALAGP
jgi:hypothetical protein